MRNCRDAGAEGQHTRGCYRTLAKEALEMMEWGSQQRTAQEGYLTKAWEMTGVMG